MKRPKAAAPEPSFPEFLKQREQKLLLGGYLLLVAICCLMINAWYPYPMGTADTGNYIYSAYSDTYGGFRPFGYSWFLAFIHNFSSSFTFIGIAQFTLFAFASAYFLLSVKFFFQLSRLSFIILSLICLLHPFQLYLNWWAMSDSLFISLSLIWLTSLLWLVVRFSWSSAIIHVLAFYCCIYTRNAALAYPFVSAITLLLFSRSKGWIPALASFVALLFVYRTVSKETHELYKLDTFSAFGGWARANNASIVIPEVRAEKLKARNYQLQMVDEILRSFPDSVYSWKYTLYTSFMWTKGFPGKAVLGALAQQRGFSSYNEAWIHTGNLLGKYGNELIKEHPGVFFRRFIIPNAIEVVHPEVTIGPYEVRPVDEVTNTWYSDVQEIKEFTADNDVFASLAFFSRWLQTIEIIALIIAIGAGTVLWFRRRAGMLFLKLSSAMTIYIALFIAFSIIAHPVHLRYLVPLHMPAAVLILLVISEWLRKKNPLPSASAA